MDASSKLKSSFSNIVKNSAVPYMLVSKTGNNISLIASSPKLEKIEGIKDLKDFIQSGAFFSYSTSLSILPEGKTFSDTVIYRRERIELYGEVLSNNNIEALLLIQINTQQYLESNYYHNNNNNSNNHSSLGMTPIIYDLKSKLSESNIYINSLKKEVEDNKKELEKTENRFLEELKEATKPLEQQIQDLHNKIQELKDSLNIIKNNTVLKFTSDLDLKKTILLITAFISMLSSAGLLEGWVSNSVNNNDLEGKVERLLELTDD